MSDTLVDVDVLSAAVQLACRAPSLHNSQPWQWVAEGAGLHLYVDRSRILPSTDKSRGAKPISAAAPCSTIYASRWLQPGGQPTSTDFPTQTIPVISHRSISVRSAASPISIATEPTQFGIVAPTGYPSPHRGTGSPWNLCCATRSMQARFTSM